MSEHCPLCGWYLPPYLFEEIGISAGNGVMERYMGVECPLCKSYLSKVVKRVEV